MNAHDEEEDSLSHPLNTELSRPTPTSSPPSFHSSSRSGSPSSRHLLHGDPLQHDEDHTLADAFGDEDNSDDNDEPDDRQRLMRANPNSRSPSENGRSTATAASSSEFRPDGEDESQARGILRRSTILPSFTAPGPGGSRSVAASNDGVFANLAAKPERGEKNEDLPPVRPSHSK